MREFDMLALTLRAMNFDPAKSTGRSKRSFTPSTPPDELGVPETAVSWSVGQFSIMFPIPSTICQSGGITSNAFESATPKETSLLHPSLRYEAGREGFRE